jgi:hypothetical protein
MPDMKRNVPILWAMNASQSDNNSSLKRNKGDETLTINTKYKIPSIPALANNNGVPAIKPACQDNHVV